MKIFKNIILGLWLILMLALYFYLFWNAIFPTDLEGEKLAEFRRERAEKRAEFYRNLTDEEKKQLNVFEENLDRRTR